ncbi:hypothetical protein LCGC14_2954110, partial [marine sediment metagenome]
MKVLLKRNWFTPLGRFKKSATKKGPPVEIPDSLRGRLPSDAVVVNDDGTLIPPIEEDDTKTIAEAAEAEGMDPLTLFDNTHSNFARIKNLWQNYKRTIPEITASKMGEL